MANKALTAEGNDVLFAIATRMRSAIEGLRPPHRPLPLADFPKGSCGDSSLLLGAYLVDSGEQGFRYICGELGSYPNDWTSHAWLERDDLVIDITADQFPDAPAAVIVERNSSWHKRFRRERPTESDFRKYQGPGTDHLHQVYSHLRPVLFGA